MPVRTLSTFGGWGFIVAFPEAVMFERLEGQTGVSPGTKEQYVLKAGIEKAWLLKMLKYRNTIMVGV